VLWQTQDIKRCMKGVGFLQSGGGGITCYDKKKLGGVGT